MSETTKMGLATECFFLLSILLFQNISNTSYFSQTVMRSISAVPVNLVTITASSSPTTPAGLWETLAASAAEKR